MLDLIDELPLSSASDSLPMEARMIGDYGDGGIDLPLDDPAFASDLEVQPGDYRDPKFFNIRFPWMDNKMDEASRISRYKLCLFYQSRSGMVLGWATSLLLLFLGDLLLHFCPFTFLTFQTWQT